MVGALIGAIVLYFVGRYVPPASVGMFSLAVSLVAIALPVASLGLDAAHIKRVSEGRDLGTALTTYGIIRIGLVILFALLAIIATVAWDRTYGFVDATTFSVVLVAVGYQALSQLRLIPATTFNALRETAKAQAMTLAEHILRLPLIILVALIAGFAAGSAVPFAGVVRGFVDLLGIDEPLSVEGSALLFGLANLLPVAFSLAVGIAVLAWHRYPAGLYDRPLAKSYFQFGLPLGILSISTAALSQMDVLMIGYFWSATDVGYYYVAQRLSSLLLVVPSAVALLFFPTLSELVAKGDGPGADRVAMEVQRFTSMIVIGGGLFFVIYAYEGIHIFVGDPYLPASPVVAALALYVIIYGIVMVPTNVVLAHGKSGQAALVGAATVAVNFLLNTILIPTSILGVPLLGLRATGAALATVLSQSLGLLLMLYLAWRVSGRVHLGLPTFRHLLAAGATGALLWMLKVPTLLGPANRAWELAGVGLFGVLLYVGLLLLLRELNSRDLRALRGILHPQEMVQYLRLELQTPRRR